MQFPRTLTWLVLFVSLSSTVCLLLTLPLAAAPALALNYDEYYTAKNLGILASMFEERAYMRGAATKLR